MPPRIKIESLAVEPAVEIVQLSHGLVTIGREPENHIVVDSVAVSRRHASIFSVEEHWMFKDFESSNGTWINGSKITPGAIKILRHGDFVKIADFSLRFSEVEPRPESFWRGFPPSLLVFYKEQFDSEFPLASIGSNFQLGGQDGDYFIEGADPTAIFFQIVASANNLEVRVSDVKQQVAVNGTLVSGAVSVTDRDELVVPPYRIVVNYPAAAQTSAGMQRHDAPTGKPIHAYEQPAMSNPAVEDGWVSEAARRKGSLGQKYLFGAEDMGGMERTQSVPQVHAEPQLRQKMASGGGSGYEMSASQKFSTAYMDEEESGGGFRDNMLVMLGVVIFILLVCFVIYLLATLG